VTVPALAFFDPVLASVPAGVKIVRAVIDPQYAGAPVRVPEDDWPVILERLGFHRVLPQLAAAAADDRVLLEPAMRQRLESVLPALAVQGLKLEQLMVAVHRILKGVGVDFIVLKGMATSQLDFPRPDLRTAVDVDLLVRSDALATALEAFRAAGFESPYEIRNLMDKGETWVDPSGWHVDVHTRPHAPGRFLGPSWWNSRDEFQLAGCTFSALNRGGRLAHAASHLALSWPSARRFSSLLDMMVILEASERNDRDAAEQFLHDIRVSDVVRRITSRVAELLDRPDLVLGCPGRRPLDLMLRRAYDRADDDTALMKASTVFGMPGRERFEVLKNWVHPSDDFLEHGGYSSTADRVVTVFRRIGRSVSRSG
jgi:hypothetical protein